MIRPVISFDCDGVIAEGSYVPIQDRTNKLYFQKKPIDPQIAGYIQFLSIIYDIYIISYRHHEAANLGLRAWLAVVLGMNLDSIAGVITYPGDPNYDADPRWKGQVIQVIGSQVHFDDDPKVIEATPVGILVPGAGWPESQAAIGRYPTCQDWISIMGFLTTPGLEFHGIERSIKSPAPEGVLEKPPTDTAAVVEEAIN